MENTYPPSPSIFKMENIDQVSLIYVVDIFFFLITLAHVLKRLFEGPPLLDCEPST